MNAPVESAEQVANAPQADSGVDQGENSHPKPHAKFNGLMVHHGMPPPGVS